MQQYTFFFIGAQEKTLEQDLLRIRDEAPFILWASINIVKPQSYGDVSELARSQAQGQHTIICVDMQHAYVDLAVDLALFLYEYTGIKPVCIYIGQDHHDQRTITVKYPAPQER